MHQELPDNNRLALRQVVRACRKAALSTVMADGSGAPYASLVTVAFDHMLNPLLLLSGMAEHSRNLAADPRLCLLLDGTDGHPNPQTGPRVSVTGRAEICDCPESRRRFLARHPGAALYAGFGDFHLWRVTALKAHFVGGFGRAVWFEAPFGCPQTDLAAQETALLSRLPLLSAAGDEGDAWRVVAVDCDGYEVMRGEDQFRRHSFAVPAQSVAQAEQWICADHKAD